MKQQGWESAWHGRTIEALYVVIYHGCLLKSDGAKDGEIYFEGPQGIARFTHEDVYEARRYMRYSPILRKNTFSAALWELKKDGNAQGGRVRMCAP